MPNRAQQVEVKKKRVKCRHHRTHRWFLDFGESIWRRSTVDEQSTRRLGWIMAGRRGGVTINIYIHTYLAPQTPVNKASFFNNWLL